MSGVIERFESRFIPEPNSGCYLWMGAPSDDTPNGQYGRFRVSGKQYKAHRIAWELYRGPIPDGMHVLHRCDNPACVRPDHLFLGTNEANVADRVAKGRTGWAARQGVAHHMAKLTEANVRSIRARYAGGESGRRLALQYKVSPSTVSEIVTRRKWAHLS